jgi:hypothetical protein
MLATVASVCSDPGRSSIRRPIEASTPAKRQRLPRATSRQGALRFSGMVAHLPETASRRWIGLHHGGNGGPGKALTRRQAACAQLLEWVDGGRTCTRLPQSAHFRSGKTMTPRRRKLASGALGCGGNTHTRRSQCAYYGGLRPNGDAISVNSPHTERCPYILRPAREPDPGHYRSCRLKPATPGARSSRT